MQGSIEVRLLAKTVQLESGCLQWTACVNSQGYGQISLDGRPQSAHRVAYELWVGQIPVGLVIDHLCRNTGCVNVDHLEAVTQEENMRRGTMYDARRAMTHCRRGHEYTRETLRIYAGTKHCLVCKNLLKRAARARTGR